MRKDVPLAVMDLSMADAPASKAKLTEKMCEREGFEFMYSSTVFDTISDISQF